MQKKPILLESYKKDKENNLDNLLASVKTLDGSFIRNFILVTEDNNNAHNIFYAGNVREIIFRMELFLLQLKQDCIAYEAGEIDEL